MSSNRYFLLGMEEIGEVIDIILPRPLPVDLFKNLIQGINTGKIPKNKVLEMISNILNNSIIKPLIEDDKVGEHIKNQFLNKKGQKFIIDMGQSGKILVKIIANSEYIKFSEATGNESLPVLPFKQEIILDALEKGDFRLLKYFTLPPDDPKYIEVQPEKVADVADIIVRIILSTCTAIITMENLKEKIKKNVAEALKSISNLFS